MGKGQGRLLEVSREMPWLVLPPFPCAWSLSRVMLSFLPLLVKFWGRKAMLSAKAGERNGKRNSSYILPAKWAGA